MEKYKKYILVVIGILLLAWGAYTFSRGVQGPGELDVITGKLELVGSAYDPDFEIEMDSPFLKRNVEMFQYYEDGNQDVAYGFFPDHQTVPKRDRLFEYKNPPFPDTVKADMFYGDVVIGKDKVHLDKKFLKTLSYKSYVNFDKENKLYLVDGLDGWIEVAGFHPELDEYYTNSDTDEWEVGDIKIYWQVGDPEDFAPVYTAAGRLEGDSLLVPEDVPVFFYDREVSAEEIIGNYKTSNKTIGVVMLVIGLGLLAFSVWRFIKAKKENATDQASSVGHSQEGVDDKSNYSI